MRLLSSLKLTVFCIFFLFVLVFWGTLEEVKNGLYLTQEKFFNSFFIGLGPIPVPGPKLILWILFFNLVAILITKYKSFLAKKGLLILHLGLLLILISGFFCLHFSEENFIALIEGEQSNIAQDYMKWELAINHKDQAGNLQSIKIPEEELKSKKEIVFDKLKLRINRFYTNARFFDTPFAGRIFRELPIDKKTYENNIRAIELSLSENVQNFILEGEAQPSYEINLAGENYLLILRKVQRPLPFAIKLLDVKRELHPGLSDKAKSYSSKVLVEENGIARELEISMNKPFRSGLYTVYQASYGIDQDGNEFSVLSVVKNLNYTLPYVGSLVTSFGLFMHFISLLIANLRKKRTLLTLVILFTSFNSCFAKDLNLNEFKKITIVDQGRAKPLDSYARSLLLRFSGKSTNGKLNASEWLAKVIFIDPNINDEKIFLINNPEIPEALGIEPDQHRRYSYTQIKNASVKLTEYAQKALAKEESQRSDLEKEFIRVFTNFHSYFQLNNSLGMFYKHPDFKVDEANLPKLNLSSSDSNLFIIINRATKLSYNLEQGADEDLVLLAFKLFSWIESQKAYNEFFDKKDSLYMIPNINIENQIEWFSPWDLILRNDIQDKNSLNIWNKIFEAYQNNDQASFDSNIKEFNQISNSILKANNKNIKTNLEILYNQVQAFTYAKILYLLSFLLILISLINWQKQSVIASKLSLYTGLALHFFGIISRILILERPPVSNLYETFIFVSFITVILSLALHFINKDSLGITIASFSGFTLLMISGKFAAEGDTLEVLTAVLNSNFWLSTHVICITTGYAGVFVAGILGHIYIIKNLLKKDPDELQQLHKTILGVIGFGLCFSFLGTMLGGIWADQSWGRFWGWDPKENGALLIVLWCTLIFHARLAGLIKERGLAYMAIIGDMVVMSSWFGINLLGVGLHSYGFTQGLALGLYIFYALELLFIISTLVISKLKIMN